jgi:hypothetical protein
MTFANRKATLRNAETLAEEFLLPFNKDLFSSQIENDGSSPLTGEKVGVA